MPDPFSPGSIIDNRYEIIAHIGEGGMGGVYKARQLDLDRIVAVKVLHTGLLTDSDTRMRFEREGRALSELSHDNILMFFQFGFYDSMPYIAMEFLEGKSLRELLDENPNGLAWQRCLSICISICTAMEYAHNHGVIHRDLKPNNIVLLQDPSPDFVKVVDFGLARNINAPDVTSQHLTQTGALIGSVYYMSPEQCRGAKADQRSDLYAVGCMLFEMLTGQAPFTADNPIGLMHKHVTEAVEFPSQKSQTPIPATIRALIRKALEKDPEMRYQSMQEFAAALRKAESGQSPEDKVKSVRPIELRTLYGGIALILVAVAGLLLWQFPPELIEARLHCSKLAATERDEFRLKTAASWAERGKLKSAVALLSDQQDEYSQLAVRMKVLRAELLQRIGDRNAAVERVREALTQLAARARALPQNKCLPVETEEQIKRCVTILHQNKISFTTGHAYFKTTHKVWYTSPQAQSWIPSDGKDEPSLYMSLNTLLRYAAQRQDHPIQARLYEFEVPSLENCTDKAYTASIYRFLSGRYVTEFNPLAIPYRAKALKLFEGLGLKLEIVDLLSDPLATLIALGKWTEATDLLRQCNALMPEVLRSTSGGLEDDSKVFVRQRLSHLLQKLSSASSDFGDYKSAESYLRKAIALTAGNDRLSHAAVHYYDLCRLLIKQKRFDEATALLNQGLAQSKHETVVAMSQDLEADVHESILPSMFICWKAQVDAASGKSKQAEEGLKLALSGLESNDKLEGSDLLGQKIFWSSRVYCEMLDLLLADRSRWNEIPDWCARARHAIPGSENHLAHAEMLAFCAAALREIHHTRESERYLKECTDFADQYTTAGSIASKALCQAALADQKKLNFRASIEKLTQASKYESAPLYACQAALYTAYAYLLIGEPEKAGRTFSSRAITAYDPAAKAIGLSICASLSQRPVSRRLQEEVPEIPERNEDKLTYLFAEAIEKPTATNEPEVQKLIDFCATLAQAPPANSPLVFELTTIAARLPDKQTGTKIARAMIKAFDHEEAGDTNFGLLEQPRATH